MARPKGTKVELECNFCKHRFTRSLQPSTFEIPCPKCKETDVEMINFTGLLLAQAREG